MITSPQTTTTEVPRVECLTYSVDESAQALGVSRPTVYRLLARQILVPVAGLRHKRIPCTQIRRLTTIPDLQRRGEHGFRQVLPN